MSTFPQQPGNAKTPAPQNERPGDVTTIWRDGEVVRRSAWGAMRSFPSVDPLPVYGHESENSKEDAA